MTGTVTRFNSEKFFGFIGNEGGQWFFHGGNVIGESVQQRDPVEFWLDDDPYNKGKLRAVEVRKLPPRQR